MWGAAGWSTGSWPRCAAEVPVVVVGPTLAGLARPVVFVREDPPGSGPLAAIGRAFAR